MAQLSASLLICVFKLFENYDDRSVKPEGFPMENGEIYLVNSNGVEDKEKVSCTVQYF